MKAAKLMRTGEPPDAVSVLESDRPEPAEGQLLVEVHEAGVNPADVKITEGYMPAPPGATLGEDFAGVVVETGPGVSGFEPGQQIYGMAGTLNGKGSGSFAEYELVDADAVAPKPSSLSEQEAGALPLTGIMALQAMTEHLDLGPGKKLLIQGGAGGIGSIAIQIAKHLGAYVATTCAGDEFDYVRELGADEVIDYTTERFEQRLSGYDAVYDL
ncbi:MAG: NADP-dependent oxidoreductase, partial [Pseudomonadota bacterium]